MATPILGMLVPPKEASIDWSASHVLKTLTEALVEAQNNITDPKSEFFCLKYMTKDWTLINEDCRECALEATDNLEEHFNNIKALQKQWPEWRLNVFQTSVSVMRGSTEAISYYSAYHTGASPEWSTDQELVGSFYWRKRESDGQWMTYKHIGIRGPGTFA